MEEKVELLKFAEEYHNKIMIKKKEQEQLLLQDAQDAIMDAIVEGNIVEAEKLQKKNWFLNHSMYIICKSLVEEMISTSGLERPVISLLDIDLKHEIECLEYYFFDYKYCNSGIFYIPLYAIDFKENSSNINLFDILQFNMNSQSGKYGFEGTNSLKIFNSNIWDEDLKAQKYLRRIKILKEKERDSYQYEKYLILKDKFENKSTLS